MPRPPAPEPSNDAYPMYLDEEQMPVLDLRGVLKSLQEQISAEFSLASVRHTELMAKFDDQALENDGPAKVASYRQRRPSQLLTKSEDVSAAMERAERGEAILVPPAKGQEPPDAGAPADDATTNMWNNRASKIMEVQKIKSDKNDASGSKAETELSKESQFAFGTKYESEGERQPSRHPIHFVLHYVRKLVLNRWFEITIASLITLNAVVMCFEVQYEGLKIGQTIKYGEKYEEMNEVWLAADPVFVFFDWSFGSVFLLEAVLKLVAFRVQYFCSGWNLIDLTCVVAFVIDKVASVLEISFLDAQVVRLIRLFRLVRLVRLVRTMEKLDMLYIMTTAIKGMKMVVVWAVLLLSLILMTCALFLSEFLHSTYFGDISKWDENLSPADAAAHKELFKYFGTFTRCMFSMFELTLANWPPVARLLTEEVSEWFSVFCLFHKLIVGFAVIGVINGVILQETFKVAQTDDVVMVRQRKRTQRAMKRKMEALFQALDLDRDGELAFSEFMVIASQPEVKLWLESLDIETDDLLTLFLLIDADGDGTLTLDEMLARVPRLRGTARGIDMLAVRKGIPPFQLLQEADHEDGKEEGVYQSADSGRSPEEPGTPGLSKLYKWAQGSSEAEARDEEPGTPGHKKMYKWSTSKGISTDKLGAITETKFHWGAGKANSTTQSLDDILAGSG